MFCMFIVLCNHVIDPCSSKHLHALHFDQNLCMLYLLYYTSFMLLSLFRLFLHTIRQPLLLRYIFHTISMLHILNRANHPSRLFMIHTTPFSAASNPVAILMRHILTSQFLHAQTGHSVHPKGPAIASSTKDGRRQPGRRTQETNADSAKGQVEEGGALDGRLG